MVGASVKVTTLCVIVRRIAVLGTSSFNTVNQWHATARACIGNSPQEIIRCGPRGLGSFPVGYTGVNANTAGIWIIRLAGYSNKVLPRPGP